MEEYSYYIYGDKIQYRKNQQLKYNFRENITLQDFNEGILLNFPYSNVYFSYKSPTTNIALSKKFKRAGVIPYTYINSKYSYIDDEGKEITEIKKDKYYCMAIDSEYGNLTDFGGGVKKYETFTTAAVRELQEESLGIFNFSSESLYNCSEAIYDNTMIILLINVKISENQNMGHLDSVIQEYYKRYSNITSSETRGMFWIHESSFYDLIKSGKSINYPNLGITYPSVYKKVADLLRSVSNVNEIC